MTADLFDNDLFSADLAAIVHPCAEPRAPTALLTTHEHIGFELGWDHAHYGVTPPAPYAQEPSPLRHGWLAGEAAFGARTLTPTGAVRQWLQLRLHAWLRGRSVELFQVTPNYLQRLEVGHCPITREALGGDATDRREASIDRVRSDAGYAAGNLVMMSARAQVAKAAHRFADAHAVARRLEADHSRGNTALLQHDGLSALQWGRMAVLCSFVEPLSHARACELPLLVLPPNRLRLFNPVQALQAFISQQLLVPGWSHRIARLEDLLPGKAVKRAFQTFFHALLPRVLEAGALGKKGVEGEALRWAIEDAWRNPLALQRWTAFVSQLSAAQCEALVTRASAKKLGTLRVQQVGDAQATEGWNLATRGYVPHAVLRRRVPAPARHQLSLLH